MNISSINVTIKIYKDESSSVTVGKYFLVKKIKTITGIIDNIEY
jgi:hypothetical protein